MVGWLMWPFLSIIVLAAVVTGIFKPVYQALKRRLRASLASLATCFIVFLVIFLPIVLFVGILSKEAYDLYLMAKNAVLSEELRVLFEKSRILNTVNRAAANFGIEFSGEEINRMISEMGKTVGLFLYQQASSIASNIFKFVADFFFMLLIIYFLLIDGDRIISFIGDLSPLPADQDAKLIQKFKDMAGTILFVNGFCGLIQGIFGGAVFAVFGLKSPFLWGLIMAILAFFPIAGVGTVFIPTAVYLILNERFGAGIFFLVSYVIVSSVVEYFLKPKMVGQRAQMHILLVFMSIICGLSVFGILGIVYGPLIVTAFLTLTDIYHASYQKLVEPE